MATEATQEKEAGTKFDKLVLEMIARAGRVARAKKQRAKLQAMN